MIYTSYFANLKSLPYDIVPVSICGKAPDWYKGFQYKKLAPKYEFFIRWKDNHDNDYYTRCFNEYVLNKLDTGMVLSELKDMCSDKDIALICYEKPGDFCHRHLVADWLNQNGIECKEYNADECS